MDQFYVAKTDKAAFLCATKLHTDSCYHFIRLDLKDKIKAFFLNYADNPFFRFLLKKQDNQQLFNMYN